MKTNKIYKLLSVFILLVLLFINNRLIAQSEYSTNETYVEKKNMKFHVRYFSSWDDLTKFNRWVIHTLEESKRGNKKAIIIDKSAYTLYLIDSGKVHSKYPFELGGNPYDDKQKEGDQCTPEGLYKVTWKRDKGHTDFYKAFLIDYPNEEDRKKHKTGSHIEIHGSGSGEPGNQGGYNWTLGCIALSNNDIDEIFPFINKGGRVTIIRYTNIDLSYIENE